MTKFVEEIEFMIYYQGISFIPYFTLEYVTLECATSMEWLQKGRTKFKAKKLL